jgi:hypothetical protein
MAILTTPAPAAAIAHKRQVFFMNALLPLAEGFCLPVLSLTNRSCTFISPLSQCMSPHPDGVSALSLGADSDIVENYIMNLVICKVLVFLKDNLQPFSTFSRS